VPDKKCALAQNSLHNDKTDRLLEKGHYFIEHLMIQEKIFTTSQVVASEGKSILFLFLLSNSSIA